MILVDPATIAIPNYATSGDEAETLILRMKHFAEVCAAETLIGFLVSDDLEIQLGINTAYPDVLRDFLETADLNGVYDTKDLLRNIEILQHRSMRISDWDNYFEVEAAKVDLTPEIGPGHSPMDLIPITKQNLLFVSIAKERGQQLVLTSPLSFPAAIDYRVIGESVKVMDAVDIIEIPEHSGRARAIAKISCIANTEFALDLWASASNAEEVSVSISLGALSLMKISGAFPGKNPRRFCVGGGFYDSLIGCQASGSGRFSKSVAQTCFELVADMFAGTDHIHGKKTAEIRLRDGAEGRRCHVTKKKSALRLMYWKLDDRIEFANLDNKMEVNIEHGTVAGACDCSVERVYAKFAD